jgi:hypothetical protein
MPSKEELLDAIKEIQSKEPTFSNCEKLATFYTLLRYLYSEEEGQSRDAFPASSGSEFRQAIAGKDIGKVVDVLDEHMKVVQALFPKEYKAVIKMLEEG